MRVRKRLPVVRWPGTGGRGGGQGRRLAPPRAGFGGSGARAVTTDLVALRARIAAIAARPGGSPASSSVSKAFPSPARGGGQDAGFNALPANCTEEATPFRPLTCRPECFPDTGTH